MKKTQHPAAKPLSLAVTAALTGLGLVITLTAPVRADTIISSNTVSTITNTTTQNITITGLGVLTGGATAILNNINNISIGTLSNNGTISGTINAISNNSTIGTLSNSGVISGNNTGISNLHIITTLNNNGCISGGTTGIHNNSTIGVLNNNGTITTTGTMNVATTVGIDNSGTIGTLNNNGTIISTGYGNPDAAGILNTNSIGTLNNSGAISGGTTGIYNTGTVGSLINAGVLSGNVGAGIYNLGTIEALSNSGTISSNQTQAIFNIGFINTLTNNNNISGHTTGIYNTGTISTLVNTGIISASNGFDIVNNNIITMFTNGQSNLAYTGNLPTSYNTYFSSNSSYGSVAFSSISGIITTYGIKLANNLALTTGIYSGVLSCTSCSTSYVSNYNTILTSLINGYTYSYELVHNSTSGYGYDLDIISVIFSGNNANSGSNNSGNSPSGITPAVIAQHNNPAYYAARVIDVNSALSNLFSGVSGTTAQSAAASQSLPLVTGGTTSVTQTALTSVNTIIDACQSANRGASSGDDFQTNHNMWLKAFGTEADQSDLDGVSGFKAHTGGVTFGADQKVNDQLTLGAAFAYANSNVSSTVGGASHGINIKGYQLIGYGSLALNNRDSVDFQLDGGMSNNSGSRSISFLNETASSSYDSWSAHLGSSLNHRYELSDRLTLTPSLRVDYTRINESGYQESGANDLDLNVNSQKAEALVFGVDSKLDYKLNDTLALAANLGVGYDAMKKQDSIVAAYAGAPNASFITEGLNQGALVSRAGVLLNYKLQKEMEISAHYDVEGRRNYLSQTASVKFNMPF